jgi:hypothetical protein
MIDQESQQDPNMTPERTPEDYLPLTDSKQEQMNRVKKFVRYVLVAALGFLTLAGGAKWAGDNTDLGYDGTPAATNVHQPSEVPVPSTAIAPEEVN